MSSSQFGLLEAPGPHSFCLSLSGGGLAGRKPTPAGEPVNSSKWKSTFSPISDLGLAKAADSPLQASSSLSQNSLFAFRPGLDEPGSADAKLAAHPRKSFPSALAGAGGLSPSSTPPNGFAFSGGLAADLSAHSFSDGAALSHKAPEVAGLGAAPSFPAPRGKEAGAAEPGSFVNKRQLDGLGGPKGEGGKGRDVGELGLPVVGPSDRALLVHSKAGKGRDREPDSKNGHNLFISAATVPPGGLLSGPGLATVASSAGSATPSAQTHRPFLGSFTPGPQFALGPMSLQANLGSSVLQSLFSSVPAAAGLVHVSSAATRLTNSHAMGSFSSGVAGGAVGGRQKHVPAVCIAGPAGLLWGSRREAAHRRRHSPGAPALTTTALQVPFQSPLGGERLCPPVPLCPLLPPPRSFPRNADVPVVWAEHSRVSRPVSGSLVVMASLPPAGEPEPGLSFLQRRAPVDRTQLGFRGGHRGWCWGRAIGHERLLHGGSGSGWRGAPGPGRTGPGRARAVRPSLRGSPAGVPRGLRPGPPAGESPRLPAPLLALHPCPAPPAEPPLPSAAPCVSL